MSSENCNPMMISTLQPDALKIDTNPPFSAARDLVKLQNFPNRIQTTR